MLFSQLHHVSVCLDPSHVMMLCFDVIKWSINFCFIMAMANDLMLAIAICHLIYPGTFMFAE